MSKSDNPKKEIILTQVDSLPIDNSLKEVSIFAKFKRYFIPRLRANEDLASDYIRSKVMKESGDVELKINQAAKLAAEKVKIEQESFKVFSEALDTFNGISDDMKTQLKFAKMLESNPDIEKQLDRVNSIIKKIEVDVDV